MNVMREAWKLYKSAGCSTKDEFALCLKECWKDVPRSLAAFNEGDEIEIETTGGWYWYPFKKFNISYLADTTCMAELLVKGAWDNEITFVVSVNTKFKRRALNNV